MLPPPDSNVTGGAFPDCEFTKPPGNSYGAALGHVHRHDLRLPDHRRQQHRQQPGTELQRPVGHLQVPIPDDYTCNDTDPLGCWTRLRFTYPAGTTVSDTTTWSAFMLGDPVRLIQ